MTRALVGHTGFVGSNLLRQTRFDACYNSQNIEAVGGQRFDLLVCCGAPAEKWKANKFPEADKKNIVRLISCLAEAKAEQVILISSVDVFSPPFGVDEMSPVDKTDLHAYGRHRRELEEFVESHFKGVIIRLPGLFGPGLKKNALFDLLHNRDVEKIHPAGRYQFYNMHRLWADIEETLRNSLSLVHFSTEPISMADIAQDIFGVTLKSTPAAPPLYDVRSRHAGLFGGAGGYMYDRARIMEEISRFVSEERRPA